MSEQSQAEPVKTQKSSAVVRYGGGFIVFCILSPLIALAFRSNSKPSTVQASAPPVAAIPEVQAPQAPNLLEVMAQQPTVYRALGVAGDHMTDTVDTGPSKGAYLFAYWLGTKGKWSDVGVTIDQTTVKLAKKDIDSARFKRLCVRGRVVQIAREKSPSFSVWSGNLMTDGYNVVNLIATGGTGELVEGSRARLCGAVTGNYAFSNVSGGQTQSLQVVGMFDLPENHDG